MTQLKISDLSVGDWVQAQFPNGDKWNERILYLSNTGRLEVQYKDGKPVRCTIDFIQPIPITPEILEKNGFAFLPDDNPRHLRFVDGNIVISTYEGRETFALYCYNDMGWTETFSQTLRYIHQLQHELRLAGVEKEIVL